MSHRIVLLPGDGIGPEVVDAAVTVLDALATCTGIAFAYDRQAFGGAAIDAHGNPLPESVLDACRKADAILLGAVGGPRWAGVPVAIRPEAGLLRLRGELGLYANTARSRPSAFAASTCWSCASSPAASTSASRPAPPTAQPMNAPTPSPRSNALCAARASLRACAAAASLQSTRRT
jgi:isocitrate/isopropylmalate dehydrogenase